MTRLQRSRLAAGLCRRCGKPALEGTQQCLYHGVYEMGRQWGYKTPDQTRQLLTLLEAQDYRCALSGVPLFVGKNASIDHIIPRSKGGTSEIANLQWVTKWANHAKWDMPLDDFLAFCRQVVAHHHRQARQ